MSGFYNDTDRFASDRCDRCGGLDGAHSMVHARYGNGGGGNSLCPNAALSAHVDLEES